MTFSLLHRRGPDWRSVARPSRQLIFALTRALAATSLGTSPDATDLIVARPLRRGRTVELVCVGSCDIVRIAAEVAARFGAEVVVRYVLSRDDPAVRDALRRGGVVVAGGVAPLPEAALSHAAA